jgi:DNA helicase-2/ATP-dependent DNA helicase PcrA
MQQEERIVTGLNPLQRKAVTEGLGNLLVLAGAGSGKTRVLVCRIAWLLFHYRLSEQSILAVTFTNKAAKEMKERLESVLNHSVRNMWVGTFHGIAHRLLRQHYEKARLPESFQILDSDDQLRMIKRVMRQLHLNEEEWPPKEVQWYINNKKDEGLRAQHINSHGDYRENQFLTIYRDYEQACFRAGVIDFAEILLRAHELLLNDPSLLSHYQRRFQAILVDEFQDTNAVQYAFIRLLTSEQTSLTVVGDDDQSIYGWRGAKIENIHRVSQDFAKVETIRLEQNYRSSGHILQASNALIAHNESRLGKSLWTESSLGEKIHLYPAFNEIDEARFVLQNIQAKSTEGIALNDIAILYRSNAQSRVLEEAFLQSEVPYRIYGGLRFFERAEIKDVMGYLRLMVNGHDDAAFERVVNFPTRGIGEKTLSELRSMARENQFSLWQAAKHALKESKFTARAHNALSAFVVLIEELSASWSDESLEEVVHQAALKSGVLSHYQKKNTEIAKGKVENIEELVVAAGQFKQEDPDTIDQAFDLPSFISHAQLDAGDEHSEDEQEVVQLMTMHAAKGLEFKVVFMVGVEEPLFPSARSLASSEKLEEERRLCYVAMTRAKESLWISYAESRHLYGRVAYHQPSRFLAEIDSTCIRAEHAEEAFSTEPFASQDKQYKKAGKTHFSGDDKSDSGFYLGEQVVHPVFGEGVIVNFEGNGEQARAEVKFATAGNKWLVLAYAKLSSVA